ncbi:radial spoke head 10 homolog B-like isoform X2 [Cimex lectularius]|uniref:Uncharacterized protein n=1 Tax=Cimex lectularius TaxID=79782 RepID=A0A8I6S3C3_CIMLE|nr:radial spoke head 10 homolog B-like isoform X2 [Cimex lectularius]
MCPRTFKILFHKATRADRSWWKNVLREKRLKRKSRMYKSISTTKSSVQSFRAPKFLSTDTKGSLIGKDEAEGAHTPVRVRSETEPISEEFEVDKKTLSEGDLLLKELAYYPAKSYLGALYINRKLLNWTYKERDQSVEIFFKNGDRYIGRISRMVMEGEGKYIWSDGTIYEGSFKEGTAHGKGSILWPNGSWYEGDMRCNLREGHGITHRISTHGEMYHYGLYRAGKKHGKGVLVYGENNWYDGDWKFGKRFGFGTRLYGNGALYSGHWNSGLRSGQGTMIWANNDIYTGRWKMGYMHGVGKYTWGAFRNTTFVAPHLNVFTGSFFEGKRLGFGHLQLTSGATIYTTWYNKEKYGNGEIICRNGDTIFARNLFFEDKCVEVDLTGIVDNENSDTLSNDFELINLMDDREVRERVKPRTINLNSPVHKMDFTKHINKLFEIDYDLSIPLSPQDPVCTVDEGQCEAIRQLENEWLEKVIMQRMADLTTVYTFYSTIGVRNEVPKFKTVMLRIMLYQLLRDCGIKETNFNAVQLDQMVGIGSNPLDKVMMYEMIHYLMTFCMLTRLEPRKLNSKIPGVIAATFDRFIDEVVLKAMEKYDGTFLKFLKHIPLQSVYRLYQTFEIPLRIKDLCKRLFNPIAVFSDKMPFTPEYFKYILQGTNTIFPDGSFGYIPFEEPFVDIKKESLKHENIPSAEFGIFADLGFENVVRCISEVVPEAMNDQGQLDGNYMLSFLDFCDILVNLATQYLDLCEEFYRAVSFMDNSTMPLLPEDYDFELKFRKKRASRSSSRKSTNDWISQMKAMFSSFEEREEPGPFIPNCPWIPNKKKIRDLEIFD